jgi:hypothetical protein
MTEQEWLSSINPQEMLHCLVVQSVPGHVNGIVHRTSDRKFRLLAIAQSRTRSPNGYWEGNKSTEESIYSFAECLADNLMTNPVVQSKNHAEGLDVLIRDTGLEAAWAHVNFLGCSPDPAFCDLIREIVGNPFRPALTTYLLGVLVEQGQAPKDYILFYDNWLTPLVRNLARLAYEERKGHSLDPLTLLALADALEEAGVPGEEECPECRGLGGESLDSGGVTPWDDPVDMWYVCDTCGGESRHQHPLLASLRSPGPKYRGLWSLDLVLGKE